jgi:hypothetical protein
LSIKSQIPPIVIGTILVVAIFATGANILSTGTQNALYPK